MFWNIRARVALAFLVLAFTLLTSCGTATSQKISHPTPATSCVTTSIQNVTRYTVENTDHALRSNNIRSVAVDQQGGFVWIGYAAGIGITRFASNVWCTPIFKPSHVNALLPIGDFVYVGTDSTQNPRGGVLRYTNSTGQWVDLYNQQIQNPLPDYRVYSLIKYGGNIYAGTYTGVAVYDGKNWTVPYSTKVGNIFNDSVDAFLFAKNGDTWVGHIAQGISWYSKAKGWLHLGSKTLDVGGVLPVLGGDLVRSITEASDGSIWIGSDGGGITVYQNGKWTIYNEKNGLPIGVQAIKFDNKRRAWAATTKGIFYLQGNKWVEYVTDIPHIPADSLAFWECKKNCPLSGGELVVAGTENFGLIIGQIP